jgi:glucosamine--fructose-6-phosphate aminotransferase (isomerizing)
MCGIIAGIAQRNVVPILLEGLKRLEYRGYDSSGVAVLSQEGCIGRVRSLGKIKALEEAIDQSQPHLVGNIGIAHTRWATHGVPSIQNAHPHICNNQIAVVHNGIIENYTELAEAQKSLGYKFTSETDSEVVAHAVHQAYQETGDLFLAVKQAIKSFKGAYAIAVMVVNEPDSLVVARKGSPMVIGLGIGENFIASDVSALLPVTNQFIFLEEGDLAVLRLDEVKIFDATGEPVEREIKTSSLTSLSMDLGEHRHFMHKEIYEQPHAVMNTLEGRISESEILVSAFGLGAEECFANITSVQILACGTSYHAGLVAKYWFEDIIGLPCSVEVASEYRYRNPVISENTLVVAVSQSGETADTLAALQEIKAYKNQKQLSTLTICNVPESSLTRESDLTLLMHAGMEVGVASTKAFTSQLVALALLMTAIGKVQERLSIKREALIVKGLRKLPALIEHALSHEDAIKEIAYQFADKGNALFLGRGTMYPIAMEGALKLKEISYIHAEAYPAGELKHGPLALIDEHVPVVSIAPNDDLLEKLKSNLQEVHARGGQMIVFEDESSNVNTEDEAFNVLKVTSNVGRITAPITFNIPLQLLAYHVALIKGTDVDQPRNLAKSVTVE